MKHNFLIFLINIFVIVFGCATASAQSYDKMWSCIDSLTELNRPKSIIAEAQKILTKAKKEKNFSQQLKAQMLITEKQCDLDPELFLPDEYEKLLMTLSPTLSLKGKGDQQYSLSDENAGRRAVLHCMLADAYLDMMNSSVHDYDEETKEQFPKKAKEHYLAALADMQTLASIDDKKYEPLVTQQEDGRLFNHDLLSVILDRVLNANNYRLDITDEEKVSLYEKAIAIYNANGNRNASTILRLRELDFRKNRTYTKSIHIDDSAYRQSLDSLHAITQDLETGADVDAELIHLYDNEDQKLVFARQCIAHWKDSKQLNAFKNIEKQIMSSNVTIQADDNILANKSFTLKLKYKNATKSTLTIREYASTDKQGNLIETGTVLDVRRYSLTLDAANIQRKADNLPIYGESTDQLTLRPGRYVLIAETDGARSVHELHITSLRMVVVPLPDCKNVIVKVLDNETGRQVPGATVMTFKNRTYKYGKAPEKKFVADKNGEVVIEGKYSDKWNSNYQVLAVRDASKYGTPNEDVSNFTTTRTGTKAYTDDEGDVCIKPFLDRKVFRPGQSVNMSAVMFMRQADNYDVLPDKWIYAELRDANENTLLSDSVKTNEFGSVSFQFKLPNVCKLGRYSIELQSYSFTSDNEDEEDIDASESEGFYVEEYKRPTFDVQFPKEKNTTKFTLGNQARVYGQVKTFNDVPVANATVEYRIRWAEHRYFWHNRSGMLLEDHKTTTDEAGNFVIDFPTELPEEVFSDSITFTVYAEATDCNGEMHEAHYSFNVKNPNQKEEVVDKADEPKDVLTTSSDVFTESQGVTVTFKAQEKDALVYYYVLSDKTIEMQGSKVLNDDELKLDLKYKKSYGNGVVVLLFYVRNGHVCLIRRYITLALPDKKLNLSWNTFRDKLQPGQQEEWVLTVKDKDNHTIKGAELCAVMYDASLDKIHTNSWYLNLNNRRHRYTNNYDLNASGNNQSFSFSLSPNYKWLTTSNRLYDILVQFEHQRYYKTRASNKVMMLSAAAPEMRVSMQSADGNGLAVGDVTTNNSVLKEVSIKAASKVPEPESFKPLRTNLSELAFFYPHLTTDSKGEAHIAFTLPDCLTEWKFMGFAHTKDMDYGTITAKAVAKKDFMVQPNMPRFLREGDRAVISAKVMNMSDHAVKGTATLCILDAKTEQVIYTKEASYNVSASQSTAVSFPIDINLKEGDYVCDVTASDGTSSDGERNRLPVLSTKVDVVENVPFYLEGPSTKDVDISTLFNNNSTTATDKAIKVTYTDNPALEVFKSLKALQNPKHENAPCYAASLYSNLVLLDMSKVLGERIQGFSADSAQATADEALSKLHKLQLADGSWSWFEGMEGSPYITLSVAEALSLLEAYFSRHGQKVPDSGITKMLSNALKYLDKNALNDYNYRKAHKLSLAPYESDLRYLAIAKSPDKELLNTYLTNYVKDFRNLTIYGRAKGVLILQKYGHEDNAKQFLESVKEYTMYKPGFGRYFATDQAYYSWMDYRIPTQIAAMRAIETLSPKTLSLKTLSPALSLKGKGDQQSSRPDGSLPLVGDVEERDREGLYLLDMQLWLLRQKQTQTWDNPINALDIADFLLTNSKEESLREPAVPNLILNGQSIKTDSIYSISAFNAGKNSLSVTRGTSHQSNGNYTPSLYGRDGEGLISWGNVRTTFKEEVTNLKQYTSGELTISRKVICDGNKLTIRLILHADRDMDFVQVTSQHAASLEPLNIHSGYQWLGGRGCYLEMHDDRATLFFDKFTRGTTTIDLDYYIARDGDYHTGFASIECTYAPDFGAHTAGDDIDCKSF